MVFNYIELIEEEERRSSHHIKWTWREWGLPYYFCPKTRWKEKNVACQKIDSTWLHFFIKGFFLMWFFLLTRLEGFVFFLFFLNKEFCVLYFSSARCIKHDVEFNVMKQIQRQQLSTFFSFYFILLDQDLLCWFLTPAIPLTLFVYR